MKEKRVKEEVGEQRVESRDQRAKKYQRNQKYQKRLPSTPCPKGIP
jgi:hypothetical protein